MTRSPTPREPLASTSTRAASPATIFRSGAAPRDSRVGAPGHLSSLTGAEPPHLARKPNYDFEKRRKELDRQAKKEAKREEKARRKSEPQAAEPGEGELPETGQPSGAAAPE